MILVYSKYTCNSYIIYLNALYAVVKLYNYIIKMYM